MKITIGADPEIFVAKDGDFIPACGMVPGTKIKPWPVNNGTVQVDGLALEIGITPTDSARHFNQYLVAVMDQLLFMLPDGCTLTQASTAVFKYEYWNKLTEDDKRLGCEPDFNAYTVSENLSPCDIGMMRVAGGHVHVGWTNGADVNDPAHMNACARLARNLDIFLGVPSIIEDVAGHQRRSMYGGAGAFRPKSYGMEYRTLSNYWLFDTHHRTAVFNRAYQAINNLMNYKHDVCEQLGQYDDQPKAKYIIDSDDRDMAYTLCRDLDIGVVNA